MEHNDAIRRAVIETCWQYLHENFHKFTEANKIKIINTICGKNVPQEIKTEGVKDTNIIIVRNSKEPVGTESQALPRPLPVQQ